jgi:hypothetical protein
LRRAGTILKCTVSISRGGLARMTGHSCTSTRLSGGINGTYMNDEAGPLSAERAFFTALLESNVEALDRVLADDFMLIDVMSGSEIAKAALLEVIRSGQLRFETIEPLDSLVRFYQTTAVVTGSTLMRGRFGATPFTAHSRSLLAYYAMISLIGAPKSISSRF